MNLENLGKNIRAARKRKGFTQDQVAELIDTTPAFLSDIERGMKTPSLNTFVDLCNVLEISADYALQGSLDAGKEHVYNEVTKKMENLTPTQRQFISDFIDRYLDSMKE